MGLLCCVRQSWEGSSPSEGSERRLLQSAASMPSGSSACSAGHDNGDGNASASVHGGDSFHGRLLHYARATPQHSLNATPLRCRCSLCHGHPAMCHTLLLQPQIGEAPGRPWHFYATSFLVHFWGVSGITNICCEPCQGSLWCQCADEGLLLRGRVLNDKAERMLNVASLAWLQCHAEQLPGPLAHPPPGRRWAAPPQRHLPGRSRVPGASGLRGRQQTPGQRPAPSRGGRQRCGWRQRQGHGLVAGGQCDVADVVGLVVGTMHALSFASSCD